MPLGFLARLLQNMLRGRFFGSIWRKPRRGHPKSGAKMPRMAMEVGLNATLHKSRKKTKRHWADSLHDIGLAATTQTGTTRNQVRQQDMAKASRDCPSGNHRLTGTYLESRTNICSSNGTGSSVRNRRPGGFFRRKSGWPALGHP